MKPDDSNLTVEEYIKYFADENATKFFNELINEVNALSTSNNVLNHLGKNVLEMLVNGRLLKLILVQWEMLL